MKLSKKTLRAIHNVFQDCGVDHPEYKDGLAFLQNLWEKFDGDDEMDVDRSHDLRPEKYRN